MSEFGANSLTLAEVLVAPTRENRLEDARAVLHDLEVQELPLPPETAVKLAQVHALTNVKMPDCCVLLAAEHLVARIGSFDDRLLRAAATRNLEALEH